MKPRKAFLPSLSITVCLSFTPAIAANLYWDGTGTSTTPTGTANGVSQGNGGTFSASSAVWDNGASYQTWDPTGNTAVFGVTGTGTGGTIVLTGFTSTSTTFNGTASWTLNGDLSGLTGVINVSTGNTNQAKVSYTNSVSNLGATGAVNVNVASGSTWYQGTSTGTTVSLTLAGVGNGEGLGAARLDGVTFAGGITLAAAADLGVNGGTTTSIVSGVISDGGNNYTLTKVATGTLNLSGVNTFTGNIVVSNGTLAITGAGQLGSGNYAGSITTAAGKTFSYASSATQTLSGAITNAGTFTQSAGTLNLSGAVANSGTLSVSGGAATLSGAVTGAGATTVSGGTLALDYTTDNTSKLSTGALTLSGGTLALTGNTAADTTQTVGSLSLTGAASLSLATQAGRTLTFDNSAGTRSGGGSLNLTSTGSGTGVFKFAGTTANSTLSWATWNGLVFAKTDALNQVTAAGQSTANSTASNLSTWTSGATQYATTGAAFTNSVGAGVAIDGVTFQDTAARTVTIGAGNTLTLNNGVIVTSAVGNNISTITGGTIRGSASGVLNLLNNDTSSSLTIASAIADNGGATGLAKYGPGTAIISGDANAFTGPVTVNGGELQALVTTATGAKSTLGSGAITANTGTTLRFKTGSIGNAMSFANAINLNGANFIHEDGVMTMSGTVTSTGTSTINGVWGGKNGIFSNVVVSSGSLAFSGSSSDSIGTVSGAGALSINSGGGLTITGDNSALGYSGNISIDASGGTFKVNSGAKLATTGAFTQNYNKTNTIDGTLSTGGNLTIAVGATNTFGGTSGTINVTGPGSYFGLNNTTTVNFTNTGSLNVQQGNVVIGSGTSGANTLNQSAGTINALGLQLGSSGVTTAQTYALTGGGRINLGANGITSVGSGTRTINLGAGTVGAQANWSSSLAIGLTDAVTGTTFNTLDSVDGATARTISLSGALSGTGALVKTGAGTLNLSGNNTYTGTTTVTGGTLRLSGTNTSAITVNSGGTLSVASAATATTTGLLTMNTGTTLAADVSTTAAFTSNGVNFAGSTSLLFNSALASGSTYFVLNYGAGGVMNFANVAAKARGTLTNDSVNSRITFTVGTAGTRTWNTTSGTWDNFTTANFTGGDLLFSNGDTVVFGNPASASVVTLVGQLIPASVSVTNTNDYTFSGTGFIAGTSTLAKAGSGTLTITTANTNSGAVSVTGGTLKISGAGSPGTGAITIGTGATFELADTARLGGGTYSTAITNTGTLKINTSANQTLSGVISGVGALVKDNTGTLALSAQNTFTGGTTVNAGVLDLTGGGGGNGTIRGTVTVNTGAILRLSAGDVTGYSTSGQLSTINLVGGTLNVNTTSNQTLGNGVINMTGGTISGIASSNLDFFQSSSAINSLASATTSTISGVKLSIRQTAGLTLTVADGAAATDLQVDSVIASNGSYTSAPLVKSGTGKLSLSGNNTYSGATNVNAGVLNIQHGNALGGTGSGTTVADGAALEMQGGISVGNEALGVSGTGVSNGGALRNISGNNTYGGQITLNANTRINSDAGTLTLDGSIIHGTGHNLTVGGSGDTVINGFITTTSGSLTKDGSGTLTLTQTNAFVGDTTISGGSLALSGSGSVASTNIINNGNFNVSAVTGGYTLGSTQTLTGNGTVTGAITIAGTLAIGASPGTMTFEDDLGLDAGSISNFEINGFGLAEFDLAQAAGVGTQTVTFGGTLNLLFSTGFNTNGSIKIFDFDGYSGGFTTVNTSGLASGYTASFDSTTGIVSVVPEASTTLLFGLGTLGLALRRRRAS